jgi:hypothetical protein
MGYRKFYYDDVVRIASPIYRNHIGHTGRIISTRITKLESNNKPLVHYGVACECGGNLAPLAIHMELVVIAEEDHGYPSVQESRLKFFLDSIGEDHAKDFDMLCDKVQESLSSLRLKRDRRVLSQKFGLDGEESKTIQEIADEEGVTRQRIHQIATRAMQTLQGIPSPIKYVFTGITPKHTPKRSGNGHNTVEE